MCAPTDVDTDSDGVCDRCDSCPQDHSLSQRDTDRDGIADVCDNCIFVFNPAQVCIAVVGCACKATTAHMRLQRRYPDDAG